MLPCRGVGEVVGQELVFPDEEVANAGRRASFPLRTAPASAWVRLGAVPGCAKRMGVSRTGKVVRRV